MLTNSQNEMRKSYEKLGLVYTIDGVAVEKDDESLEDIHKDIIARAKAGSADAAKAHRRIDLALAESRIEIAKTEITTVMSEYEKLLETSIQKSGESENFYKIRIWVENSELSKRFEKARRLLNEVAKLT